MLEAEELVGHEFNDEEDHCIAVREMVELGAREAIMTAPDGCFAQMAPDGARRASRRCTALRVRSGVIEPRATVGSGDAFLAGFVAARYNGLGHGGVPGPRRRVRRAVDAAPRRRADRPRPGRAADVEIEVERPVASEAEVGHNLAGSVVGPSNVRHDT